MNIKRDMVAPASDGEPWKYQVNIAGYDLVGDGRHLSYILLIETDNVNRADDFEVALRALVDLAKGYD